MVFWYHICYVYFTSQCVWDKISLEMSVSWRISIVFVMEVYKTVITISKWWNEHTEVQ